jgi:hypothetical protein
VQILGNGQHKLHSWLRETSGMIANIYRQPAAMVNPFEAVRSMA